MLEVALLLDDHTTQMMSDSTCAVPWCSSGKPSPSMSRCPTDTISLRPFCLNSAAAASARSCSTTKQPSDDGSPLTGAQPLLDASFLEESAGGHAALWALRGTQCSQSVIVAAAAAAAAEKRTGAFPATHFGASGHAREGAAAIGQNTVKLPTNCFGTWWCLG